MNIFIEWFLCEYGKLVECDRKKVRGFNLIIYMVDGKNFSFTIAILS